MFGYSKVVEEGRRLWGAEAHSLVKVVESRGMLVSSLFGDGDETIVMKCSCKLLAAACKHAGSIAEVFGEQILVRRRK